MTEHSPTQQTSREALPNHIEQLLQYPNVAITDHQCPRPHCGERLVFTGTEHTDITDDAGYIVRHEERQAYRCFADHRVYERGPEIEPNT